MQLNQAIWIGMLLGASHASVTLAADQAAAGFVTLPKAGFAESAYIECNATGNFGKSVSKPPIKGENDACFVTRPELMTSQMNAPLEGFNMVGMLITDVAMPAPYAGENNAVAVLSDTFWRNKEKTECILGTHLEMRDAPLADGQYWEVNDIARAGFAGKDIAVAYFYKPHSQDEGGNTEMLFRAGRTFTSVQTVESPLLPTLKNPPAVDKAISRENAAAISENWVDFTTDINFKDPDGFTRQMTSMLYIKYPCDARDVVEKEDAISFRTTGQNGQKLLEIKVPGLVPVDAEVERY